MKMFKFLHKKNNNSDNNVCMLTGGVRDELEYSWIPQVVNLDEMRESKCYMITRNDDYIFKDENGNVINAVKIVLEKKEKKYPETFKECRDYIESCYDESFCADLVATGYKSNLIESFAKLLVCRDAYWRIAGKEIGLEKPWEPDWKDNYQKKWTINFYQDEINRTNGPNVQFILAFPSEEMRDAFYNNFKELIEQCKELL